MSKRKSTEPQFGNTLVPKTNPNAIKNGKIDFDYLKPPNSANLLQLLAQKLNTIDAKYSSSIENKTDKDPKNHNHIGNVKFLNIELEVHNLEHKKFTREVCSDLLLRHIYGNEHVLEINNQEPNFILDKNYFISFNQEHFDTFHKEDYRAVLDRCAHHDVVPL